MKSAFEKLQDELAHKERDCEILQEQNNDLANSLKALLPWAQAAHPSELSDGTPCDCDRCDALYNANANLRAVGRL